MTFLLEETAHHATPLLESKSRASQAPQDSSLAIDRWATAMQRWRCIRGTLLKRLRSI
jgi:hypothetical protein